MFEIFLFFKDVGGFFHHKVSKELQALIIISLLIDITTTTIKNSVGSSPVKEISRDVLLCIRLRQLCPTTTAAISI